jgi:hypothetical protein
MGADGTARATTHDEARQTAIKPHPPTALFNLGASMFNPGEIDETSVTLRLRRDS